MKNIIFDVNEMYQFFDDCVELYKARPVYRHDYTGNYREDNKAHNKKRQELLDTFGERFPIFKDKKIGCIDVAKIVYDYAIASKQKDGRKHMGSLGLTFDDDRTFFIVFPKLIGDTIIQ